MNGCFKLFTRIKKGSGTSFSCRFSAWFFHKNVPYLLYQLTKFQCHVFFPSHNIKQDVLLSSHLGWHHKTLKLMSTIFHYFKKKNVFLRYFEQSTLKRNLTYSCFFFPLFHKHLFSPGLPRATRLLETSCLEKITVCVIETMLVTLPLVQMNKARREVNRTNQVQTKINIVKGLQISVNPWEHMPLNIKSNEIFFKKYILVETFSSDN